jgi:hypothetical protein
VRSAATDDRISILAIKDDRMHDDHVSGFGRRRAGCCLRVPVARFILIVIPGLPRINPRQNPESALSAGSIEAGSRFHPRFIADGPE